MKSSIHNTKGRSSRFVQVLELIRLVLEHPSWLVRHDHRVMLWKMVKRIFGGVR
jgi:hypothetical protein